MKRQAFLVRMEKKKVKRKLEKPAFLVPVFRETLFDE